MSIASLDANGAPVNLASTPTAEGELPSSTQADPITGLPFKGASEATLAAVQAKLPTLVDGLSPVQLAALSYPVSTGNSTTGQLQANTKFAGVIETVQNLQAAQVQVVCDQPYTLVINQYIDAAGLQLTESTTFVRGANQPVCLNVLLPGNFFNLTLTNNGIEATEALHIDTTFGIMDTLPKTLGQKVRDESMAVTLSSDDVDLLNDIRNALAPLMSARGTDGALRIQSQGGTLTTITTVGTLTTVTTVTTVGTVNNVANQTAMGGLQAVNHIPALMNIAAASNINLMVG